jgi:hypothetical protein
MGLVGRVPALRRAFIREAAGLSGDLPRLMQGRRSEGRARVHKIHDIENERGYFVFC